MSFFLDNNVLIGYIFETDNWNAKSLDVMCCDSKKLSSDTVQRECSEIYSKNIGKIKREFQKVIKELNQSTSLDMKKLSLIMDKFNIKEIIIKFIGSRHQANKELIKELRRLLRDMEYRCLKNYQNLEELVEIHTRNEGYKEIYQIFENDGLVKTDPIDVEIIIDAHHVGLQERDLSFISGDYEHIVSRKDLIESNTSLKEIIGLGQFEL